LFLFLVNKSNNCANCYLTGFVVAAGKADFYLYASAQEIEKVLKCRMELIDYMTLFKVWQIRHAQKNIMYNLKFREYTD